MVEVEVEVVVEVVMLCACESVEKEGRRGRAEELLLCVEASTVGLARS